MDSSDYQRLVVGSDGQEMVLFHTGKSIFSNFHPAHFVIDGQNYLHCEQYFQAKKAELFGDNQTKKAILRSRSPLMCKNLGFAVRNFDMTKFNEVSDELMKKAVMEKFKQNPEMRQKLLETGSARLVQATRFDRWWASGLDIDEDHSKGFPGYNKLGDLLSNVRACI
jgi:ribA/ribD-fused uncharacterized protein